MGRQPSSRKNSDRFKAMPLERQEAETAFYRCPRGHALPRRTNAGECTPIYCVDEGLPRAADVKGNDAPPPKRKRSDAKAAEAHASTTPEDETTDFAKKAERNLKLQAARAEVRKRFMNVPDLKGADAEAYADSKAVELLPMAMAELEYQLRYGDDAQRWAASKEVRDMTGRGKRDASLGGGPVIIIKGDVQLPWLQKPKVTAVIDASGPLTVPVGALPSGEQLKSPVVSESLYQERRSTPFFAKDDSDA